MISYIAIPNGLNFWTSESYVGKFYQSRNNIAVTHVNANLTGIPGRADFFVDKCILYARSVVTFAAGDEMIPHVENRSPECYVLGGNPIPECATWTEAALLAKDVGIILFEDSRISEHPFYLYSKLKDHRHEELMEFLLNHEFTDRIWEKDLQFGRIPAQ